MSDIEDILRQFRPAKEPEGFWDRVREEKSTDKRGLTRGRGRWILAAAAAVLFALVLGLGTGLFRSSPLPLAPELALGKIRHALEAAETACIRFTVEPDGQDTRSLPPRKTGVLFLKRGDRVNLSVKEWDSSDTRGVPLMEARLVSDGHQMERCLLRRGTEIEAEKTKPESISSAVADWYLRGADLASWPAILDLAQGEAIRDVRSVPGTPGAHAVSYRVGTLSVTLWYDPVTFKPLRRSFRSEGPGGAKETYQEYEFNEDMPDSLFALANDK